MAKGSALPFIAGAAALLLLGSGKKGGGSKGRPYSSRFFNPETADVTDFYSIESPGIYPQEGSVQDLYATISGQPDDPEMSSDLESLQLYMDYEGIDPSIVSAVDVTTMPKAPGDPVAIPPFDLWPNIITTIKLYLLLRQRVGLPMNVRGYRPPDYNEAVGGSDRSTHQWFSALDIRLDPEAATTENKRRLGDEAAQIFKLYGDVLNMGFGIYGSNAANVVHFDSMRASPATWEDADEWLSKCSGC